MAIRTAAESPSWGEKMKNSLKKVVKMFGGFK